ncbi:hypothetical protein GQ457_07G014150 [Hibiscus cannabinus]
MGHEQCKMVTTRSKTKASNDAIQVEENEQLSNEENESPEIATTIPHATATKGTLPEDAAASSHVAANSSHNAKSDEVSKGKEIHLPPPFPQRLRKQKYEYQFKKFLDILKQVHINLPLVEAIEQMPNYAKFLKDIVSKRTRLSEFETVAMTEGCMAMLHNRLPPKLKDPGSFTIPCAIGNHYVGKALCDLGASINIMPKSVFERLGIGKARPTTVMLQLADRSYIQPEGKIEDILVRVDKFIFPADFIVVDCEADKFAPIILGRPFLATGRTLIDVEKGQLTMRVNEQQVTLDVFKALKRSDNPEECHNVNVIDAELETYWRDHYLTTESESENFKEQKPNKAAQQEENRVLSQPGSDDSNSVSKKSPPAKQSTLPLKRKASSIEEETNALRDEIEKTIDLNAPPASRQQPPRTGKRTKENARRKLIIRGVKKKKKERKEEEEEEEEEEENTRVQIMEFCGKDAAVLPIFAGLEANPTALEYQFEPEIERVCRRNRKESRAMADPPNNRNAANNNQIAAAGGGNPPLAIPLIQVQNRSIRDHLLPDLRNLNPGIVTPEIQAAQFELKPVRFNMLNSIGQFGGLPHEDARQHLRSFIEVCDSFRQQGVHEDVLRLKLFPYSLRDRARLWFNSIPSGLVESWDDLCRNFIIRYSSIVMTDKLRNDITSFRQTDDESMYEAWDRYKELFRKCPMHGFNEWTKVIMFYNGVNAPTRMMLDASANGTLLDKSTEEAIEILDRLANNDYQFPSTRRGMARRNGTTYELEPTDSVSAQLATLTNMVKKLQRPSSSKEVKVIASYCDLCNANHDSFECPHNPESSFYVGNFNRNNNPYSNTL